MAEEKELLSKPSLKKLHSLTAVSFILHTVGFTSADLRERTRQRWPSEIKASFRDHTVIRRSEWVC